jgi:hypothetical protein
MCTDQDLAQISDSIFTLCYLKYHLRIFKECRTNMVSISFLAPKFIAVVLSITKHVPEFRKEKCFMFYFKLLFTFLNE